MVSLSTSLALKKNRFESKSAAMPCVSVAILAIKTVFSFKIVRIQVNGLFVIHRRPRLCGAI